MNKCIITIIYRKISEDHDCNIACGFENTNSAFSFINKVQSLYERSSKPSNDEWIFTNDKGTLKITLITNDKTVESLKYEIVFSKNNKHTSILFKSRAEATNYVLKVMDENKCHAKHDDNISGIWKINDCQYKLYLLIPPFINKKYCDLLGVTRDSSLSELKEAYKKAAKRVHPDLGGSTQKMADINRAYQEIIKNNESQEYLDMNSNYFIEHFLSYQSPSLTNIMDEYFSPSIKRDIKITAKGIRIKALVGLIMLFILLFISYLIFKNSDAFYTSARILGCPIFVFLIRFINPYIACLRHANKSNINYGKRTKRWIIGKIAFNSLVVMALICGICYLIFKPNTNKEQNVNNNADTMTSNTYQSIEYTLSTCYSDKTSLDLYEGFLNNINTEMENYKNNNDISGYNSLVQEQNDDVNKYDNALSKYNSDDCTNTKSNNWKNGLAN